MKLGLVKRLLLDLLLVVRLTEHTTSLVISVALDRYILCICRLWMKSKMRLLLSHKCGFK